jgi:hypothetical protein
VSCRVVSFRVVSVSCRVVSCRRASALSTMCVHGASSRLHRHGLLCRERTLQSRGRSGCESRSLRRQRRHNSSRRCTTGMRSMRRSTYGTTAVRQCDACSIVCSGIIDTPNVRCLCGWPAQWVLHHKTRSRVRCRLADCAIRDRGRGVRIRIRSVHPSAGSDASAVETDAASTLDAIQSGHSKWRQCI